MLGFVERQEIFAIVGRWLGRTGVSAATKTATSAATGSDSAVDTESVVASQLAAGARQQTGMSIASASDDVETSNDGTGDPKKLVAAVVAAQPSKMRSNSFRSVESACARAS